MSKHYLLPSSFSMAWFTSRFWTFYSKRRKQTPFDNAQVEQFYLSAIAPTLSYGSEFLPELIAIDPMEIGHLSKCAKDFYLHETKSDRGRARFALAMYMADRISMKHSHKTGYDPENYTYTLYPLDLTKPEYGGFDIEVPDFQELAEFADSKEIGRFSPDSMRKAVLEIRTYIRDLQKQYDHAQTVLKNMPNQKF